LSLLSCRKDNTPPSKTDLLTSKIWINNEYYIQYGTSDQRLLYKKGALDNTVDLSNTKLTFKKDGTYQNVTGNVVWLGKWQFSNNETQIEMTTTNVDSNTYNKGTLTIKVLNNNQFDWHNVEGTTYASMVPQ
jgi:hypothetical protein